MLYSQPEYERIEYVARGVNDGAIEIVDLVETTVENIRETQDRQQDDRRR